MLMARLKNLAHNLTAPINVLLVLSRFFSLPFELPHLTITSFSCVCIHPIDPLIIHLLKCVNVFMATMPFRMSLHPL